jgi:hypothetical protein
LETGVENFAGQESRHVEILFFSVTDAVIALKHRRLVSWTNCPDVMRSPKVRNLRSRFFSSLQCFCNIQQKEALASNSSFSKEKKRIEILVLELSRFLEEMTDVNIYRLAFGFRVLE